MGDANGRYRNVGVVEERDAAGRIVACLERRFTPAPQSGSPTRIAVAEGDRIDLLAQRWCGDPLRWWEIADANLAMDPQTLTHRLGRILVISQAAR